MKKRQVALAIFTMALAMTIGLGLPGGSAWGEMSELETFIRARIEIGESMMNYMSDLSKGDDYNPGGGRPSMEQMQKMEEEINARVGEVLESLGLTIKQYDEQSPKVFSDKADVQSFLEAHPDLKKRYEVLPLHRSHPRSGPS